MGGVDELMAGSLEFDPQDLAGLRKAFRDLPKDIRKEIAGELKPVAERVAADAAARTPIGPTSFDKAPGRARASFVGKAMAGGATVGAGKNVPYYKWLDFGSRNPQKGNNRAEGPWRGSGAGPKGGRYLYPALIDHNADIVKAAGEAVEKAARSEGFK